MPFRRRRSYESRAMPAVVRDEEGGTIHLRDVQNEHSGFQADFDDVYRKLLDRIGNTMSAEDQESLVPLIMSAVRLVEEISRITGDGGSAKQQLVMALMTRLIADSGMSEENKITVQAILERFGPSIIDGLVTAAHGRLIATGVKKFFANAFAKLRCCRNAAH